MPRKQTSELTKAHRRILDSIGDITIAKGHATPKDIVKRLGFAGVTSLTRTLHIMNRNGFIEIHGGGNRGERRIISLTRRAKAALGFGCLPLLGEVPAGPLAESVSRCDKFVDCNELLPHKRGDFLLRVNGDSMIGDGILPGDLVLIRPGLSVYNGEIGAVHVGDEYFATLKHIHFKQGNQKVVLKASNPTYSDIVVQANSVKLVGIYKGLLRTV